MPKTMIEELVVDNLIKGPGYSFMQSELSAAFDRIANIQHWKGPIDAVIDADQLLVSQVAVQFYTATELTVTGSPEMGKLRVQSIGYAAGPAGDH